jgi:hypothetical protein
MSVVAAQLAALEDLLRGEPSSWAVADDTLSDLERGGLARELLELRLGALSEVQARAGKRLGTDLLEWVHRGALGVEVEKLRRHAGTWGNAGHEAARDAFAALLPELEASMAAPHWVVVDLADTDTGDLGSLERAVLAGVTRAGTLVQLPDALVRRLGMARYRFFDGADFCVVGARLSEHDLEALAVLHDRDGQEPFDTLKGVLEVMRAL